MCGSRTQVDDAEFFRGWKICDFCRMIDTMDKFRILVVAASLFLLASAAHAQILKSEPGDGALPRGKRVLVDDGSCPAGQIKEVVGGSKIDHVARSTRCIPHGGKK
jgi:hypothetical protein